MGMKTQKTSTATPHHKTTPYPRTYPILPILSILLSPKPAFAAPSIQPFVLSLSKDESASNAGGMAVKILPIPVLSLSKGCPSMLSQRPS